MKARITTFVLIIIFLSPFRSIAQEAPLLLEILPSPSINGHGGAGTAFPSEDAFGFFYNPAHLGNIGNKINFSLHVYPQKMSLFSSDKPEYKANAGVLAYQFRNFKNEKILNLGIGYLNSEQDVGEIIYRDSLGTELARALNFEFYDFFAIGIGFEYFVDFNFGFTYKRISSNRGLNVQPDLSLIRVQNEYTAVDYGMLITLPLSRVVPYLLSDTYQESKFKPYASVSMAYAFKNYGDEITYNVQLPPEPLPRSASLGYSVNLGIETSFQNKPIRLFDFIWTSQADDPLVKYQADGFSYQAFIGDINIGKNIINARGDNNVISRKGLAIELVDFFRYTWGSYSGGPYSRKNTNGFGIRTKAIFKLLQKKYQRNFLSFIYERIDIAYHKSTYYLNNDSKTTYHGIAITISGW